MVRGTRAERELAMSRLFLHPRRARCTHQLPAMLSVRLLARAEELHKKGSPLSGLEALRGVKGDLNNQVD